MSLFVLAYLGGVLTIVSPCIFPVLPFVFARSDRPFIRSGLPLLAGMAATFAAVASLVAVGGGWAVEANAYGRAVALALLAFFGLTLLFPALSDRLTRPLVGLGNRFSQSADQSAAAGGAIVWPSLLLGVADGVALGALRRTGVGPDLDRSGPARRQRTDFAAARRLCVGGGDVVGAGFVDRRTGI